jgi:hypothetical protein
MSDMERRLIVQRAVTLVSQSVELLALLSDAIGVTFVGLATRASCGLFHQLPEIVLKYGDAIVELGSR